MEERQERSKARAHLMVRSLTRLRHPKSLRFFFSFCFYHSPSLRSAFFPLRCFRLFCRTRQEEERMWKSMRTALYTLEVLPSECYWYAECELANVSHNHSEYFIDISDHSGRSTDSLFFRSLRWIDVRPRHWLLETQQRIHSANDLCATINWPTV